MRKIKLRGLTAAMIKVMDKHGGTSNMTKELLLDIIHAARLEEKERILTEMRKLKITIVKWGVKDRGAILCDDIIKIIRGKK